MCIFSMIRRIIYRILGYHGIFLHLHFQPTSNVTFFLKSSTDDQQNQQNLSKNTKWMSIIKSISNYIGANSNPLTKLLSTKLTFIHWNLEVITFQGRWNRGGGQQSSSSHISGGIEVKTSPSNGLELLLSPTPRPHPRIFKPSYGPAFLGWDDTTESRSVSQKNAPKVSVDQVSSGEGEKDSSKKDCLVWPLINLSLSFGQLVGKKSKTNSKNLVYIHICI